MKLREIKGIVTLCALLGGFALIVGCDWTSGGDSWNTSGGAGSINFSGVYNGNLSGGRAVERTTGGPVTRLVLSQQGNALEVTDNNGSTYRGTIGASARVTTAEVTFEGGSGPVGDASDNAIPILPEGLQFGQAQVSFSGNDNVAAKTIEFAGSIYAVAVTKIRGETTTDASGRETEAEITYTQEITRNELSGSRTEVTITIIGFDLMGNEVFRSVETFIEEPDGRITNRRTEVTDRRTSSSSSERIASFTLNPGNVQYRMEGTWIEQGGTVAGVDALAAGSAGVITTPVTPSAN